MSTPRSWPRKEVSSRLVNACAPLCRRWVQWGPRARRLWPVAPCQKLGYAGRLTPLKTVLPADITADELRALRGLEGQVRPVANRQLELLPNGRLSTPMGWGHKGALRNIRIEEEKNREGVARQVLYADQVQLNRPGQDTAAKWIGSKALLTESQGGLAMDTVDSQGRVIGQINPQMVFGKAASPQLMAMQYFAGMERAELVTALRQGGKDKGWQKQVNALAKGGALPRDA